MTEYDREFDPPAPVIEEVRVYDPLKIISKEAKGKLDSGADKSVIPETWIDEMKLLPAGEEQFSGYNGRPEMKRKYFVHINLNGYTFFLDVISSHRTNVLLGRDILNQLKLVLNGKNENFEISDP